jgi:hypothetical protein
VILAAAASYALLFAMLLVEALRGFSLVRPDAATLTALTLWAVISGLAFKLALPTTAPNSQHAR